MARTAVLGFPRIGAKREVKTRAWPETRAALTNLVEVTRRRRTARA